MINLITFKTKIFVIFSVILVSAIFLFSFQFAKASSQLYIYNDLLSSAWVNWSWGTTVNFSSTQEFYTGIKSISFIPYAWSALYLHTDSTVDLSQYERLVFSLKASSGSPKFKILFYDSNNQQNSSQIELSQFGGDPIAGSWKTYSIPIAAFPIKQIKGFAIQESLGVNQQTVFMDDVSFIPAHSSSPVPSAISTPVSSSIAGIYEDSLSQGWINWSWGAMVDFGSNTAFSGTKAIAANIISAWGALYMHSDLGVDTTPYTALHFALKPTDNNLSLQIALYDQNNQALKKFVSLANYGALTQGNWKVFNIPLSDLNGVARNIKGVAIQDSQGRTQSIFYLDELNFSGNNQTITQPILPAPIINTTGYKTSAGKIYNNSGSLVSLKGVNWFGFETDVHVVHGLWARNYKEMIAQMKNLGFNAVRIPVCPATLNSGSVSSIDYSKNPDLAKLNSLQVLDKVLNELNSQGMYIVLDHHRPDCAAISELWYTPSYSEAQWVADLKFMADRYKGLNYFIGIDLKNEPHGQASWGTGNLSTDWNRAAERAGSQVLLSNQNILVFIEGVGENPICSSSISHFWGENLETQSCAPITGIPSNKIVFSPHIYGPDVSYQPYFNDSAFPGNMPSIWDKQFGYLATTATIIPGEWGGKYGTNGGLQSDVTLQNALTSYLKSKHICNSFYWSWNPNSRDTGGVLQDDWRTPWGTKVNLIENFFNSCY